jgi:hypothetical protein
LVIGYSVLRPGVNPRNGDAMKGCLGRDLKAIRGGFRACGGNPLLQRPVVAEEAAGEDGGGVAAALVGRGRLSG